MVNLTLEEKSGFNKFEILNVTIKNYILHHNVKLYLEEFGFN